MICARCGVNKPGPAFPLKPSRDLREGRQPRLTVCRLCKNAGRTIVSAICDEHLLAAIDAIALRNNTSRAKAMSDLIRQALDAPQTRPRAEGEST